MGILITTEGPEPGRTYPLDKSRTILGRQFDSTICLNGREVSRQHAQIVNKDGNYEVEDLDSSNGTFVNGVRLQPHNPTPITERDTLQIGKYVFSLRPEPTITHTEPSLVVREQVKVTKLDQSVYGRDAATKLKIILEIAQDLAHTLDVQPLLDRLLERILMLFPQADRAMALTCEGDNLVVRSQKSRRAEDATTHPYSRTIVRKALDDGVGLLSEDAQSDQRFGGSNTITSLGLHSVICVPLIGQGGRRLGVLQVDRFRTGGLFQVDDLQLMSAVAFHVSAVLENAALHAERLAEQRLKQELALAQEIQQGFLPTEVEAVSLRDLEIFGRVFPARKVAGDLYDYFPIDEKLAFIVGDVSGKGMPAALFMVAVHTLCRHVTHMCSDPVDMLTRLNAALAADNPAGLFVTIIHGMIDPANAEIRLASGGHPPPLMRMQNGEVCEVNLPSGRLIGFDGGDLHLEERSFSLKPGEMLLFYTDGIPEARPKKGNEMFGLQRLIDLIKSFPKDGDMSDYAEQVYEAVEKYSGSQADIRDDVTLLMIRRKSI